MRNWTWFWLRLCMGLTIITTAHGFPLDTDDAGTLGRGVGKMELNVEHAIQRQDVQETESQIELGLAYGVVDNVDLKFAMPYRRVDVTGQATHTGAGDFSAAVKWHFHRNENLALGLKLKWLAPTGEVERGLGKGKPMQSVTFIASHDRVSWAYHVNAEYRRHGQSDNARAHRGRLSVGIERHWGSQGKLMADLGVTTPVERTSSDIPLQLGLGWSYRFSQHLAADIGWKRQYRDSATHYTGLAGLSVKF